MKKQQQQTGTFNLTKQRASSAGETFTISEENWIQKNYFLQKAFEKTTGKFNLTKQRASSEGETFTISEENCIKKELWTVLTRTINIDLYFNRLSKIYFKSQTL